MRPSGRTRQPSGEQISRSKREYEQETGGEPRYAQTKFEFVINMKTATRLGWQNAENSGWNSPNVGVACRYGQLHRGVDTGPGHHGIDRIFQTITIGLMFPSAARPIAVDGGGMGGAMKSPPFPLPL
jgi:hypothetical protein